MANRYVTKGPRKKTWAQLARANGTTTDERKLRLCLGCRKDFLSEWIGNRMCEPCKAGAARPMTEFDPYQATHRDGRVPPTM
jgi:hypothetical protein